MSDFIGTIIVSILMVFVISLMTFMSIMLPFQLYADNVCLKKGYPKAHTTYTGDIYCSNLSGSVTILVEKQ